MQNIDVRTARSPSAPLLALLVAAGLAMTACSRDDNRTAGQKLDSAVAKTEQKSVEVAKDAKDAGREAGAAVARATEAAGDKTKDAAITAAVNAKLVADSQLSALSINVDTSGGRVVLRGTAPDTAARTRATELARTVDGVSTVENELTVQAKK